jgi:glyoxylase I family protein
MERVTGIGGFFFRSKDPHVLARWYADNLGVTMTPHDYNAPAWRQEAGTTVFEPFKQETTYFGEPRLQWMINFRVRDLDRMVAQLQAKGIVVEVDPDTYPNGRFARLNDPEGNPIQLWQPDDKDPG